MSDEFNDEHSGKGGSYVVDADGKRVLQERTDTPIQTAPASMDKPTSKKEKGVNNA